MTLPPTAPPAADADRREIAVRASGPRQIALAPGLLLEWQADLPANAPGGVIARHDGGSAPIEIETPPDCQGLRLVVETDPRPGLPRLAVQIMLRATPLTTARTEAVITPHLARRAGADSSWRAPQAATRARLPLAPGRWHRLAGLFALPRLPGDGRHDVVLPLPGGYRIDLAQIDADALPVPPRALPAVAAAGGIAVLLPFATEVLPEDSAPEADPQAGARPALPALAAWLAALAPPDRGAADTPPPRAARLTADLLMAAQDSRAAVLAEAACARAGHPLALARDRRGVEPDLRLAIRLLDDHIGCGPQTVLAAEDHRAMAAMAQAAGDTGLRLAPPRALLLASALPEDPADRAARQALLDSGLLRARPDETGTPAGDDTAEELGGNTGTQAVTGGNDSAETEAGEKAGTTPETAEDEAAARLLTLAPEARLSEIALALLSCLPDPVEGLRLLGPGTGAETPSWAPHVVGAPDPAEDRTVYGHLGAMADPEAPGWPLVRPRVRIAPGALPRPDLDPDHAFALVVCPGDPAEALDLINIENCLVFDSFEALRRRFGPRDRARMRSKPVIPLGPHLPRREDHVVRAVARHWAYGGRHVLGWLACDYDQIRGRVRVGPPPRDVLRRFALTDMLLSLPLAEALEADMARLTLTPACGFAIACALPEVTEDLVAGLRPGFAPEEIAPEDHLAMMQAGPLDSSVMAAADPAETWPAAPLLRDLTDRHDRLRQRLEEATARPDAESAARALELIAPADPDRARLADEIAGFLAVIAWHPDLLLALPPARLGQMLELARSADSADRVAAGLAVVAAPLCQQAPQLARPLVELLAQSLPAEALAATLAQAIAALPGPGAPLAALTGLMARFCPAEALLPVVAGLSRAHPEALRDEALAESLHPLCSAAAWPALRRLLGIETANRIERLCPPSDRMLQAIEQGDRAAALRAMDSRDLMERADPVQWFDPLRAHSASLRALALPVAGLALPGADSQPLQRLAGVVLSDRDALDALRRAGALDERNALNAMARGLLDDPAMLEALIGERFEGTPWRGFPVAGDSTEAVFDRAAAHLAGLPVARQGPLVSVIVSAWNPDPGLLRRALASVQAQTHANLEILIVDDASTPDSAAAIAALADAVPQARVLRMAVNSGPYLGRNRALAEARGDFIAIQDADDWAHPQRLAAQLAAFEASPGAQMVTTAHVRIDRDGRVQPERRFELFGDGPMSALFRRDLFETLGDFIAIRSRGDVEMRERIRSYHGHAGIVALPQPMMLCFAAAGTLSQRVAARQGAYLQLMRRNIDLRPSLAGPARDGRRLPAGWHMPIPRPLRAPGPGDTA